MAWRRNLLNFLLAGTGLAVHERRHAWKLIEPEQLQRFLAAFRVDCVFDVGANVGQYAQGLRELGYRDQIISFEPNPDVAAEVRKAAAGDAKWEVRETALDSVSRQVSFKIMRQSQFSSLHDPDHSNTSIFTEANIVERTVDVQTTTIAKVLPELERQYGFTRPFLKMDTQGHDLEVATGAGAAISRFVGLQSELSFTPLYEGAPVFERALQFYKDAGFKLSGIIPNNAGHFPDLNESDCLMYNPAFIITR